MNSQPRIAIIGAGLAGLTAAYRLSQQGLLSTVYEASGRVGGRVLSAYLENYRGTASVVELGGQNITDGGEARYFIALAQELGLSIDTQTVDLSTRVYVDGTYVDFQHQLEGFLRSHPRWSEQLAELADQCHSMAELINRLFAADPLLRIAITTRMVAYEGLAIDQQSIYHNLDTLHCLLQGGLATAHEAFASAKNHILTKTIAGGNAQLPVRLAAALGDQVQLNKPLVNITKIDGQFQLIFAKGSSEHVDKVILAIPASTYPTVQIAPQVLDPDRYQRLQAVGYGQNYKILCPFMLNKPLTHRSIITKNQLSFFNHDQTISILYAVKPITEVAAELEIVQRGYQLSTTLSTTAARPAADQQFCHYQQPLTYCWTTNPYAKGSYSGYSTTLSHELDETVMVNDEKFKTLFKPTDDGLFFIGEHTTLLMCVGTLEAAVESGERISRLFSKNARK